MTPTKALRIYIAGPYSADSEDQVVSNVAVAIDAAIHLVKRGHYPFVPHLTHFVDLRAKEIGAELLWEDYLRWDMEWLKLCDAVLFLGNSKGADLELQAAVEMGKEVYYSLDGIPGYRVASEDPAS